MRVKVEVVETTLRVYEIEGVTEDKAKEIISTMYEDFAEKGISPDHGKNTGFSFQIRSTAPMPQTLKWETCQICDGSGTFPHYIKLDKKTTFDLICTECSGKGVMPTTN